MTRLSVLVVNWNGKELVLRCLAALRATLDPAQDEVIVVDNGSSDGSAEAMQEEHPWATLIRNAANLGYAAANNQAFQRSRGTYILMLNPDAEVTPGAVDRMISALNTLPRAGAVTGKLVEESGEEQRYLRAFPSVSTVAFGSTFLRRLLPRYAERVVREYRMLDADLSSPSPVPQPPGACLMVRRSVVGRQLLDERFPLYFNDVDLCKRIWRAVWRIYYIPDAVVVHIPNRGGLRRAGTQLEIEHAVSMVRYFRKYHSAVECLAVYMLLLLHYSLGLCASHVLRMLHKRPFPAFDGPFIEGVKLVARLAAGRSFFDNAALPTEAQGIAKP
jgi:hypothetical protein